MTSRLIDITIHDLSSAQAVTVMLNHFAVSTSEPVVLMTRKGKIRDMVAKMRTELSRVRSRLSDPIKLGDREFIYFGFTVAHDDPLVFASVDGFREAVALYFNVTPLQNIRNTMALESASEKWI